MPSIRAVAVIPARYDSERFPGKVLADVEGKPLIQWVVERTARATRIEATYVATDSPAVREACLAFTPNVVLSEDIHASGTDRVAELARDIEADVFINVQTDEPMMEPELVDALVDLMAMSGVDFASAVAPIHDMRDFMDPNVVKVVWDGEWDALYFSRAPIPWPRGAEVDAEAPWPPGLKAWKHIGIYGYRRTALLKLTGRPRSELEVTESLEQLRVLDQGWPMRILEWDYRGIGVDTEDDLARLREYVRQQS